MRSRCGPLPCTTAPAFASRAMRAAAVLAAMVATLALGGDAPNPWRFVADIVPEHGAALLGLGLATLVGSGAALAARATVSRLRLPGIALGGAMAAMLAAPHTVGASAALTIVLAAAHVVAERDRPALLVAGFAVVGAALGGIAGCAALASALWLLLRPARPHHANDNAVADDVGDRGWTLVDQPFSGSWPQFISE